MIRRFDEFTLPPDTKGPTSMRISLTTKGILSLNAMAFRALGEPRAVLLYFDRINSLIGVRPARGVEPHAYPLARWGECGSRIVRIKKFCNYYGLQTDTTVVFNRPECDERGLLVLDLKDVREAVRRSYSQM